MKIPLNEFEQYIDETMLNRGFQYFKKGYVQEIEEVSKGEYQAVVHGSEPYVVHLFLQHGIITDSGCSCPYDLGPVCKHIVAAIFYMQKDVLNLEVKPQKSKVGAKPKEPKKSSKMTLSQQVAHLLGKLSHEDLKGYIIERCDNDRTFRQLFLAQFAYLVVSESKALYAKQIHSIVRSAADRWGNINYSEARRVGNAIYELILRAEKHVVDGNYSSAMYIACAILEEITKALSDTDDSSGEIGGCIEPAIDILEELSQKPIPEQLRTDLFAYCITSYKNKIYKGWDWHFSILQLATSLAKNRDEAEQIEALLDTGKSNDRSWDYKRSQDIRLELITKMDGDKAAAQFIEQNVSLPSYRKKILENAIAKKDYSKAITIAEDGIKLDEHQYPGIANDWRVYLLTIYTKQNDVENCLKYARHLFLYSNREKKEYYDIMKHHVSPDKWGNYLHGLLIDVAAKSNRYDHSSLSQIYIWEEQWDKLLEIVKQHNNLLTIEGFEKYLVHDYADEVADLYQTSILEYMVRNMSREHYQNACRYIRRMKKIGATEKANFVINQLKSLYPKRKALMEELAKV